MTKYIEVAVPDEDYVKDMSVSSMMNQGNCTEGEPQRISHAALLDLVAEFCSDIQTAHGMSVNGRIDEDGLDWPDLADTYRRAHALLAGPNDDTSLTAEQLNDKYSPNGDGQHPVHTRFDWVFEVKSDNTLAGYWDWVVAQIEASQ